MRETGEEGQKNRESWERWGDLPKVNREKLATEKRLDRQVTQSIEVAIRELPALCDCGTKKNA